MHSVNRVQYQDQVKTSDTNHDRPERAQSLVSVPLALTDTGLSQSLLEDIVVRQINESGVCDLGYLMQTTALSSNVLEELVRLLRADARLEVRGPGTDNTMLRYALTDVGKKYALEAKERSGYVGPAPIAAEHYIKLIESQRISTATVNRSAMQSVFNDVYLQDGLLDKLGAAMNSGKAMFVYGHAGTGKTFICKRLIDLLDKPVYIPHAIAVEDSIVRLFDGSVHEALPVPESSSALLADQVDPRLVLCKRPFVCSGGELRADMLEISSDEQSHQFHAPLQLKATHGIYMIDDLGRQKISTGELFNRWIVPMESREDYLALPNGHRLRVPFDVLLVFSTNLKPSDLDDPAFQRRVGHKIFFDYVSADTFRAIWQGECARRNIDFDPALVNYVIEECFQGSRHSMAACHARDLMNMALDYCAYDDQPGQLSTSAIYRAWENLFCSDVV